MLLGFKAGLIVFISLYLQHFHCPLGSNVDEWLHKILNVMDEYLLSNPLFCRAGSKWQYSPEIQSQITGGLI